MKEHTRLNSSFKAHKSLAKGFDTYFTLQESKAVVKQTETFTDDNSVIAPNKLDDKSKDIIKSYTNRNSGRRTLSNAFAGIADKGYKR